MPHPPNAPVVLRQQPSAAAAAATATATAETKLAMERQPLAAQRPIDDLNSHERRNAGRPRSYPSQCGGVLTQDFRGDKHMSAATLSFPAEIDILRYAVTDEQLETAAEETALSYTYQTSRYDRCCN
jgi:hypothetical protein